MTDTEYAKLIAQGYDPNKRTPVDRAWRGRRPSQEASANSGADTRQSTPDRRRVGRIYGSLGGYLRWFCWKMSDTGQPVVDIAPHSSEETREAIASTPFKRGKPTA